MHAAQPRFHYARNKKERIGIEGQTRTVLKGSGCVRVIEKIGV